jgi:4-carboxymuconolactone decarboxylase
LTGPEPRIRPAAKDSLTDVQRAALGRLLERDPLDNVWGTFVRHPDLFRRFSVFGEHVLRKSTLSPRLRELAILRIGWRNRCEYEFAQHTRLARTLGLSDNEIARVMEPVETSNWTDDERNVLRCVDELVDTHTVSNRTWAGLRVFLDVPQVMDLIFAIGNYNLVSWALNSFGVQIDAHLTDYPWAPEG